MSGFLLDTNVLSALRRPNSYPAVESWLQSVPSSKLHLSVITLGEIRGGIERKRRTDGPQAAAIEGWYRKLLPSFSDRIVGIDQAVAEKWGSLGINQPIAVADGLIAATAVVRGLTLVTRNTRDFEPHGVSVFNPFGI